MGKSETFTSATILAGRFVCAALDMNCPDTPTGLLGIVLGWLSCKEAPMMQNEFIATAQQLDLDGNLVTTMRCENCGLWH